MLPSKHILLLVIFQVGLFSYQSESHTPKDVASIVKSMVQSIKNDRDVQALKQMDMTKISAFLLEDYNGPSTNTLRSEFDNLITSHISKYIFAHLRNTIKEASTITYGAPEVENDKASVLSIFKILNPVKNQEIKLRFSLTKSKKGWKITDLTYAVDRSIFTNLRDDKIRPWLKAGGLEHAVNELRKEQ